MTFPGSEAAKEENLSRRKWVSKLLPYTFVLPFIVSFLIVFAGPAAYSLILSLADYRGYGTLDWIGLKNYATMLQYDAFWITLRNTAFYWIAHAIPMMSLAFLLAVLIQSRLLQRVRYYKTAIFLPQMIATVAAALIFQNFFGTHNGVLNAMTGLQTAWLSDPDIAPWTVVLVLIWRGTGYWFIIFLAGLSTIDPEIDEAARIDGAGFWQRIFQIKIPLMRPIILFAFVVDGVITWRLFSVPNVLLGRAGGLASIEQAPVLNLVVESIKAGQFGLAAASGWIIFLIIATSSTIMYRVIGRSRTG